MRHSPSPDCASEIGQVKPSPLWGGLGGTCIPLRHSSRKKHVEKPSNQRKTELRRTCQIGRHRSGLGQHDDPGQRSGGQQRASLQ